MSDPKHHRVGPAYRKNDLSLQPGGSVVTTVMKDGRHLHYDNIKNVRSYVYSVNDPEVESFLVNGKPYVRHGRS